MIEPAHPTLSLRRQCQALGLNRSTLYYSPSDSLSDKQLSLLRLIDETYTRYPFFGTRQMASYLRLLGYDIHRHHTRWGYEKLGLRAVAPGPHTSKPHPAHKIYPYLLRGLAIERPNHVWSTDISVPQQAAWEMGVGLP